MIRVWQLAGFGAGCEAFAPDGGGWPEKCHCGGPESATASLRSGVYEGSAAS